MLLKLIAALMFLAAVPTVFVNPGAGVSLMVGGLLIESAMLALDLLREQRDSLLEIARNTRPKEEELPPWG